MPRSRTGGKYEAVYRAVEGIGGIAEYFLDCGKVGRGRCHLAGEGCKIALRKFRYTVREMYAFYAGWNHLADESGIMFVGPLHSFVQIHQSSSSTKKSLRERRDCAW